MPSEATIEAKPRQLTPAEDAARIASIIKLAGERGRDADEPVPSSLVEYLAVKGFSLDDASAAYDAWAEDRYWRSPLEGVAWGTPAPAGPGDH